MEKNKPVLDKARMIRIVHKELFSNAYKKFSDYFNYFTEMYKNLTFGSITTLVQEALFKKSGTNLKDEKNIQLNNKPLTHFMNGLELKMYTKAIEEVTRGIQYAFPEYITKYAHISPKIVISLIKRNIAESANISNQFNVTFDKSGEPIDGYIKQFDRSLKLGKYEEILKTTGLILNKEEFDPYSDRFKDRYRDFRKDFIKKVTTMKDLNIADDEIYKLFQRYDTYLYDTDYIEENKINTIKYMLGLTDDVFFNARDFLAQEVKLRDFDKIIEFSKTASSPGSTYFYLSQLARENRDRFKGNNPNRLPELSNLFIVSCLDKIATKKSEKSNIPLPTHSLAEINCSIEALCNMTSKKLASEVYKPVEYQQPNFWDFNNTDKNLDKGFEQ